jgi:hypothetical protein
MSPIERRWKHQEFKLKQYIEFMRKQTINYSQEIKKTLELSALKAVVES